MACHALEGQAQFGPTWSGLFGRHRTLKDGSTVLADEAYLRESITDPGAKAVPGFEAEMPAYAGVLNENQIESLVLYIKTLQ